tara:strand:+ start:210 stop:962 length:753 start_codon:yes stop_codon:yes gene_type:complete
MRPLLCLCLTALLTLQSQQLMAAEPPVEFGLADFPPYFYVDEQGEPAGAVRTLADALFAEAGLSYHLRDYPPARLYNRLKSGDTQITMAAKDHPEFSAFALQGKLPLLSLKLNVYRHVEAPPIRNLRDLAGHSVILIGAYTYGALSQALQDPQLGVTLTRAATHQSALQMLLHRRAEYLINYSDPMTLPMRTVPQGQIVVEPLSRIEVYLFVSKATAQAEALRDQLDDALLRLRESGELRRILDAAQYAN